MLQIRLFLSCLTVILFITFTFSETQDSIEWILEHALEEELTNLDTSDIITPIDFKNAANLYKNNNFRKASALLEDLIELQLPDGQLDFISFMLGECYRKLSMKKNAKETYGSIIKNFPTSDKIPAVYFRLLQYAYDEGDAFFVDSLVIVFKNNFQIHPLNNSVLYLSGKLYFKTGRFGEAIDVLQQIPKFSSRYFQGKFLTALSLIKLKNTDKAISNLSLILDNCSDEDLVIDAKMVIGDIYLSKKLYNKALSYFQSIDKSHLKYHYSLVKIAQCYLKLKDYQRALAIANSVLSKGKKTGYFFEMASIIEQTYKQMGDEEKNNKIKKIIQEQNMHALISFETNEELTHVYNLIRTWKNIEYKALSSNNNYLAENAQTNITKLINLKKKFIHLLYEIGAIEEKNAVDVPGLAQQRYLGLLRKNITHIEETVEKATKSLHNLTDQPENTQARDKNDTVNFLLDSLNLSLRLHKNEYDVLKKTLLESGNEIDKFGTEIQARYVDWSFMRYLEKKKELDTINAILSQQLKNSTKPFYSDSASKTTLAQSQLNKSVSQTKHQVSEITPLVRDRLIQSLNEDRNRIIEQIALFIDTSPNSAYNPQILFRLAELKYDVAAENFSIRLEEFEKNREKNELSDTQAFPEYELDSVILIYDQIVNQYPKSLVADDAMFYKAHALKKLGQEDRAKDEFKNLTSLYPESEYFVEANMNIGSYFFANPTLQNDSGYKLAEEAYRRVLAFRDHPQFVHAIYHLGWCYYMQDQYDDAISVFKYLVEEVNLDFSLTQTETKQVLNPLMREEAIDYIAISFDERNDLNGAVAFLSLIGNIDYAALVFKRMGELREEDLDYEAAIHIYNRLILEYSMSSIAPRASENLIKIYESNNKHAEAMTERELFFKRYARGTDWYKHMVKNEPQRVASVDSMTIAIGLYVADALYREAEKKGMRDYYIRATNNYGRLVTAYGNDPIASEAFWNLAIILDQKLNEKERAYKSYLAYSRFEKADVERREQAALNAIALAQRMADTDTAQNKNRIDQNRKRILQAGNNYLSIFPEGKSYADVVMNLGSVYFNRKMYTDAIATYRKITKRGILEEKYYDAGFLISKCYFGEEDWLKAAGGFEKVWKESANDFQKKEAYKLLLQSKFLYAKQRMDSGDFENAAIEYRKIDREFPGSEYGDITLFNSAEAFEKLEDWTQSCRTYYELYSKYPHSKLAPDALFNAALNYEKIKRFSKSAEMYEIIISQYSNASKAKDALYNVGFSYEKLGKLNKMAEANERYSTLYPGEKDVELMLFRSANFYFKSLKYDKSIQVYKNHISLYPKSDRIIESFYKIGQCYYEKDDHKSAIIAFNQAEERNLGFLKTGLDGNAYYAAEAAFSLAKIEQQRCSDISFDISHNKIKENQKLKAYHLLNAIKGFQRVMKYKSENMFEAGYRIGEMYEEYAYSWSNQKLPKDDPIKLAILKKDIYFGSASLMKKSFLPFKRVIELADDLDTILYAQQIWIDSAKTKLSNTAIVIGNFMINGIGAMQKSPIPSTIKSNLLFDYQYRKQLLETLEPLKIETRNHYLSAYKELKKIGVVNNNQEECFNKFGQINFLVPNEYESLSEKILTSTSSIPKNLNEEKREELIFQLEDIVFELQDKALFGYEDALNLAQKEGQSKTKWYKKILDRLARLNPETYGKRIYLSKTIESDLEWIFHKDSVKYWNASDPFGEGWQQVQEISINIDSLHFSYGSPKVIGGPKPTSPIYLWRNAFLNGIPREGKIQLFCQDEYRLFLNEKLISAKKADQIKIGAIENISGISQYLKGGDNIIAIEIVGNDSIGCAIALCLHTLLDTSEQYKTVAVEPKVTKIYPTSKLIKISPSNVIQQEKSPDTLLTKQFKSNSELLKALTNYRKKTDVLSSKIRKERLEVQKFHIKIDAINRRISKIREEIKKLKNKK